MKCWRTHSSGVKATYVRRKGSNIRLRSPSVIIFAS